MTASIFPQRRFCSVFVIVASALGCARSETDTGAILTSPSSLSGISASTVQSSTVSPSAGPGLSYDATGLWHHVVTLQAGGEVIDEAPAAHLTQDADGNISYCGECEGETWRLTRLGRGTGRTIAFRLSLVNNDTPQCELIGTAQLDTATNSISGRLTHATVDEGCPGIRETLGTKGPAVLTLTRNP